MRINKLDQFAQDLAAQMDNSKQLLTSVLQVKLAKLAEAYPYDQTLVGMSNVLNKMSSKHLFIKKAELVDIYKSLYTSSSKAGELLQEEIGDQSSKLLKAKYASKQSEEILPIYESADPVLKNALSSIFSNEKLKVYSDKTADKALNQTKTILSLFGVDAKYAIAQGNEDYIIIEASLETPKGVTSFYVPVKTANEKVNLPEVFVGNEGAEKISKASITNYIKKYAGNSLRVSSDSILNLITKKSEKISQVELAVASLRVKEAEQNVVPALGQTHITGQEFYPDYKDVQPLRFEESETFESKLSSPKGVAEFEFGSNVVEAGRSIVDRILKSAGQKYNQIKVAKHDNKTIFYAVSTGGGKLAFTVPVKVNDGKVKTPGFLICNGSISPLNSNTIQSMTVEDVSDKRVSAFNSPQYGMKNSELLEIIRTAAYNGNHDRAEDALNVIMQSGDSTAYDAGVKEFMAHLGAKKQASSQCSLVVKSASTSTKPLCGHLNLPLDQVYQDKHGSCKQLSRKHEEFNNPEVGFMFNKIFI